MGVWTKAEVRRAIQAVENKDRCVETVEIWPDGRLRVLTAPRSASGESRSATDWTDLAGETQVHGS
jgi:hypothetical protein